MLRGCSPPPSLPQVRNLKKKQFRGLRREGGASGPLGPRFPPPPLLATGCFLGKLGPGNYSTATNTSKSSGSAFPGVRSNLLGSSGLSYGRAVTVPLACLIYFPCSSLGTHGNFCNCPLQGQTCRVGRWKPSLAPPSHDLTTRSPPAHCKCCPRAWSKFSPVARNER